MAQGDSGSFWNHICRETEGFLLQNIQFTDQTRENKLLKSIHGYHERDHRNQRDDGQISLLEHRH